MTILKYVFQMFQVSAAAAAVAAAAALASAAATSEASTLASAAALALDLECLQVIGQCIESPYSIDF